MKLNDEIVEIIRSMTPDFGYNGFGEFVFYRTYSRTKPDGKQEDWADVVIRVTEGIFSIREKHYHANGIPWDESHWQVYARNFAISMFKMEWLPPGRGLWVCGTDFMWERGSAALNNCAYKVINRISRDAAWVMDMLMNGVGVGFEPVREDSLEMYVPGDTITHTISDDREGWVNSVEMLIESYMAPGENAVEFDYSLIRGPGLPIRGFGGVSSGPAPLQKLHKQLHGFMESYLLDADYDSVRLKMDIVNAIGACVVAGNVRRSAEIAIAPISDPTFMDMKDYDKYPERAAFGWLSNNSVILEEDSDFDKLGEIAQRVIKNGEPGFLNRRTLNKGRLGKSNQGLKVDKARGLNPCGEQPLEDGELCCLAETLPTRCADAQAWYKACEYATMYASTVTLLPTHSELTNAVMLRNRRIGVSIVDVTGWLHRDGAHKVTQYLRKGYDIVRDINRWTNSEAGIPEAIRVTTIKPGGSVPKVAGRTGGIGYPTFHETLMRVRVAKNSNTVPLLIEAGIPYEDSVTDPEHTYVFEWPVQQGPAKPATKASIWEQAANIVLLQREWSDNAVSNTIYFRPKWRLVVPNYDGPEKPEHKIEVDQWGQRNLYRYDAEHEEGDIERMLSMHAPLTKSISMLPHAEAGVYPQSPQEGLTPEEYAERISQIRPVDWSKLRNADAIPELYCTGDKCEIVQ